MMYAGDRLAVTGRPAAAMTRRLKFTDGSDLDFPVIVAEDAAVLIVLGERGFRCSADAAHLLSEDLFKAALEVEGRQPAPEGPGDD